MKKAIFYEILRKLKREPQLMRKLKIFAAVGIAGLLITTGLAIWAGISALNYLTSKAGSAAHLPLNQEQIQNLKTGFQQISQDQVLSCWNKAQSLLAIQPWLERPALDNLESLKVICLQNKPKVCEGESCQQAKRFFDEGSPV